MCGREARMGRGAPSAVLSGHSIASATAQWRKQHAPTMRTDVAAQHGEGETGSGAGTRTVSWLAIEG